MLCRKHSIRTCLLRLLWNMGARRYVFLSVLTYLTPQRERLSLDLRDSLLRTEDISCTSTQQQFPIPKRKSSFTLTIRPHFPRMKENLLFYFLFFLFTFFFLFTLRAHSWNKTVSCLSCATIRFVCPNIACCFGAEAAFFLNKCVASFSLPITLAEPKGECVRDLLQPSTGRAFPCASKQVLVAL